MDSDEESSDGSTTDFVPWTYPRFPFGRLPAELRALVITYGADKGWEEEQYDIEPLLFVSR